MNFKNALLITYPIEESVNEALSLAETAGYVVKKIVKQKHITQSKYGIGKGKAYEIKDLVNDLNIDIILFDEVLKPTQQYNLAFLCKRDIIDRERLILEIFERRASTSESRIQIKLAQLKYEMVRIKEKVRLAKMGEQPGFFGLGKYDADVYSLDLKSQMSVLKKKLEKEEKRRTLYRNQRNRMGISTISLVGYTSSGKTTLFNSLTGESKEVGKEMFTTLSTFTRSIYINSNQNQKLLLSDTVGFVNKLPAYMIDAFKSTLHELVFSKFILLVIDVSQTIKNIRINLNSCLHIINELQIPSTKILYLLNKVDLTTVNDAYDKAKMLDLKYPSNIILPISAKTGYNVNKILDLINKLTYGNNLELQNNRVIK
jgi:GTP-binding protein HflX